MRRYYGMVLYRDQSVDKICMCIGWLRRENARGAHIFVRPDGPHALSLIDDVGADAFEEMVKTGFEPGRIYLFTRAARHDGCYERRIARGAFSIAAREGSRAAAVALAGFRVAGRHRTNG